MSKHPPHGDAHSRTRVEALDLLRLIAVLGVMLFHYAFRGAAADGLTTVSWSQVEGVAKYGYLGVQMFFVISGFVIAYSADGRTAIGFAIARAARIYPAFVFCMTLTFLVMVLFGAPRFEATFAQWAANLAIVSPALKQPFMDGAYWSIVYELVFYSWIFLLIAAGAFRRRIDLIVAIWLTLSMVNEFGFDSEILRKLLLTGQSGFFAAGLMLYEMYRERRDAVVQVLFAGATAVAVVQGVLGVQWLREHFGIPFSDAVVAAVCLASIAAVAMGTKARRVRLPARLVVALGGLTYPLYLLHQHIGYIALTSLDGYAAAPVLVCAVILGMCALAFVTWRFVDLPGQQMMRTALTKAAVAARLHPRKSPPAGSLPAVAPIVTRPPAQARHGNLHPVAPRRK